MVYRKHIWVQRGFLQSFSPLVGCYTAYFGGFDLHPACGQACRCPLFLNPGRYLSARQAWVSISFLPLPVYSFFTRWPLPSSRLPTRLRFLFPFTELLSFCLFAVLHFEHPCFIFPQKPLSCLLVLGTCRRQRIN